MLILFALSRGIFVLQVASAGFFFDVAIVVVYYSRCIVLFASHYRVVYM